MENITAIARKTNEATAWNAKNDQESVGSDASAAEPPHLVPGQRMTPVCSARNKVHEAPPASARKRTTPTTNNKRLADNDRDRASVLMPVSPSQPSKTINATKKDRKSTHLNSRH